MINEEKLAQRLGWKCIRPDTDDYGCGYRWLKPNGLKSGQGPAFCLNSGLRWVAIGAGMPDHWDNATKVILASLGIPYEEVDECKR